jgi:magnesium-transporting ATPase (P-type)
MNKALGFVVLRWSAYACEQDSSHQLMMITGDAPLTACHAAKQVHILDRPVLMLVHRFANTIAAAAQQ